MRQLALRLIQFFLGHFELGFDLVDRLLQAADGVVFALCIRVFLLFALLLFLRVRGRCGGLLGLRLLDRLLFGHLRQLQCGAQHHDAHDRDHKQQVDGQVGHGVNVAGPKNVRGFAGVRGAGHGRSFFLGVAWSRLEVAQLASALKDLGVSLDVLTHRLHQALAR